MINGGNLVVMRPVARLAPLLGLEQVAGQISDGYLQIDANHPVGRGIATESLQFHGPANLYRLAGATALAWLSATAEVTSQYPAITLHPYGQGRVVAWAFDLARSIVYTRQGNPALANQESPEWDGLLAVNMFRGWIDLDRLAIPQADEQQRFFANLLTHLSQEARPLPRLWYFPGQHAGMLVATGDYHTTPHSGAEDLLQLVEQRNGQFSIYYTPLPESHWRRVVKRVAHAVSALPFIGKPVDDQIEAPSPSLVAAWRERGHEFGLHPYVDEYSVEPGLEAGWRRYRQEFTAAGYGPVSPTVRTHRVIWTGWVETARVQASYGIRMNLDYYHFGPLFKRADQTWAFGYFTGSGLPMRFVDAQGRILNIYQQLTQLVDEHLLDFRSGGWVNLRPEAAVEVAKALLVDSVHKYPGVVVGQFHVDPFSDTPEYREMSQRFLEGALDCAVTLNLPIWSAERWLAFVETRQGTHFEAVTWSAVERQLTMRVSAMGDPHAELSVMVPLRHGSSRLSALAVNGANVRSYDRRMGGVEYACVTVSTGQHTLVANYAGSTSP